MEIIENGLNYVSSITRHSLGHTHQRDLPKHPHPKAGDGRCTPVACNTPPGEAYTQTGLAPAVLGNKTISKEPLVATQSIKFNC